MKMAEQRKTYTAEFKVAAVKLITEQGYSLREAARNLGVSEKQLRKWKRSLESQDQQAAIAFPGKGNLPPVQEEIRRLKEENQRLRMERDILKKATIRLKAKGG
jgi:transposase